MPHLLIERIREFPLLLNFSVRKEIPAVHYLIEVLDIAAALIFILGSICFLPSYARDVHTFVKGCELFVIGSIVYVLICGFTLGEAVTHKGFWTFEAFENLLYLVGSSVFFVGTLLYWPDVHVTSFLNTRVQDYTRLVQYDPGFASSKDHQWRLFSAAVCEVNKFDREFSGSIYFIVGSVLFAFAAYANALNQRKFDGTVAVLHTAVTTLYFAGSLLFALGSVAFLPHLGCQEGMVTIGAWNFIVGSALFLVGSLVSLWRTTLVLNMVDKHEAGHLYGNTGAFETYSSPEPGIHSKLTMAC